MIFLVGFVLSFQMYQSDYDIVQSFKKFTQISPEGLLSIFLPLIIFPETFKINFHYFERVFWQVMVLAFPCFLVTAGISAVGFQYIIGFGNDITWP